MAISDPRRYAQSLNIEGGRLAAAALHGDADGSEAVTLATSRPAVGLSVMVLLALSSYRARDYLTRGRHILRRVAGAPASRPLSEDLPSTGSSAISAFLAAGRRGPARPAAYVDGEHGSACGEARVAVGEQRQGVYALGILWVDHAAGAVG
ncbi:MAG TPA: hypothetical protein VI094_12415, partial [Propionibacteriaceae bacterium]